MKNLGVFEPQIENHCLQKHVLPSTIIQLEIEIRNTIRNF